MRSLLILIVALTTLASATPHPLYPIKIPRNNGNLYTLLDGFFEGDTRSDPYLQELLSFGTAFAIKEGITKGQLNPQANWTFGEFEPIGAGYLQDSQAEFYFAFTLKAGGEEDRDVTIEIIDQPLNGEREVVFLSFKTTLLTSGVSAGISPWPVSFSLYKVQNSQYLKSLVRLGIEYTLAQAHKSGVLSTEKYEVDDLLSVSFDVVNGTTFYAIDVDLILPEVGSAIDFFVIKDDPKENDVSVVSITLKTPKVVLGTRI